MVEHSKGVETPAKVKMVTVGMFKQNGVVFEAGSEVMVTADDMLANPGNFVKVKKVVAEPEFEPLKGKK